MNRLFLSLRVQDKNFENIDPYTVTTWKPVSANSVLALRLCDDQPKTGSIDPFAATDFDICGNERAGMLAQGEAQVMVLFPPVHRQEVKAPHPRKSPQEIRRDYMYMELAIKNKENENCMCLRSPKVSFIHEPANPEDGALLQVESPTFVGKIQPIAASPSNSTENVTFLQSKRLLELKKPRSGVFINEQVTTTDCDICPSARRGGPMPFDPRQVQSDMDTSAKKKFIVKADKSGRLRACIEPCRQIPNNKSRGTQAMFDHNAVIHGSKHLKAMRKDCGAAHALFSSMVAFLYSKLEDVKLWNGNKIDEILQLGLCQHDKWLESMELPVAQRKGLLEFDINTVPRKVELFGYRVDIDVEEAVCRGTMTPQLIFVCSELNRGIAQCFMCPKSLAVLIHVGDIGMILWRSGQMYYLFDGFARDGDGHFVAESDKKAGACLLMNNRLTELNAIVDHNIAMSCIPNTTFVLHNIRVISVDKIQRNAFFEQSGELKNADVKKSKSSVRADHLHLFSVQSPVPNDELSILSAMGGKKRKRPVPSKSLKSMQDNTIVTTESDIPLVDKTLNELCETTLENVIEKIENKIENRCIVPEVINGRRARKVLIHSDLGCLQQEKRAIHRGLEIDPCAPKSLVPNQTMSQELALPTNFRTMPDGSMILHGTQNLMQVVEYNASISVIAPVLAVLVSYKYAISTWDSAVVDFILNTTKYVQECVPFAQYQMFRAPRNHLPDIQVGSQRFSLSVNSMCVGPESEIESMLRGKMFPPSRCERVVISSAVYNAAVFRRHNFWYLFDAFPCDPVGIRSRNLRVGMATLQRFAEFTDLVHRVRCNQSVGSGNQMFSLNRVIVKDVTDTAGLSKTFKFVDRPIFKEKEIIERLAQEQEDLIRRNNMRLRELNALIKEEKCRIKKFNKKAGREMTREARVASLLQSEKPIDRTQPEEKEEDEDDTNEDPKNNGKKSKEDLEELTQFEQILRQPYGYTCIEPDHFHKIQGSTSLPNRFRFRLDHIRACHFCSVYATLLAFNRKWEHWNFRTVDQCIEEGLNIYHYLKSNENLEKRFINRLQVDQSYYQINIERYGKRNVPVDEERHPCSRKRFHCEVARQDCLGRTLEQFFEKRRYVLVQFPNCTFAIIKRDCYNLFDPYASHELREGETPYRLMRKQPTGVSKVYAEKNTASWICIPTLPALLNYVEQRIRCRDLNKSFQLYTIKVVGMFPPVPKHYQFAHHMMAFSLRQDEQPSASFECLARSLPDEQVRWLDAKPAMVPWSRRLTQNLMGKKRYTVESQWKSYDCELEGELYSLWANLHPMSALFKAKYRGRQFAGIYVIAGCIAALYPLEEWNTHLMNYIVVEGDRYFASKMTTITTSEYEVQLEDLRGTVELASFTVDIDMKLLVFGTVYSTHPTEFNLKRALLLFFKDAEPLERFGVLHCFRKSLAFGRTARGQYFMYDCMSLDAPLFVPWEGAAYVLLCNSLRRLLHCIVLTLRVPCYNVEFTLHNIECVATPTADTEDEEDEKTEC